MPIELRRALISDVWGDWDVMRELSKTAPDPIARNLTYSQDAEISDRWRRDGDGVTFQVSALTRVLRLTSTAARSAHHYAPSSLLPAKVRVYLALPAPPATLELGNPETQAILSVSTAGNYELTASPPGSRWRVAVKIDGGGSNRDALIFRTQLWEYLDLEPWLDDIWTTDTSTQVVTVPKLFTFKGSHFRTTGKTIEAVLLVPRTASAFVSQLEDLLSFRSPHRFPLELFIDGFLWRVGVSRFSQSLISGTLYEVRLSFTVLSPFARSHDFRRVISSTTSLPFQLTTTRPSSLAPTPLSFSVRLSSGASPATIRFTLQPVNASVSFNPDQVNGLYNYWFSESGKLFSALEGASVVTEKTPLLSSPSPVPFRLLPGTNVLTVEFLDRSGNQITSVPNPVWVSFFWFDRTAEFFLN